MSDRRLVFQRECVVALVESVTSFRYHLIRLVIERDEFAVTDGKRFIPSERAAEFGEEVVRFGASSAMVSDARVQELATAINDRSSRLIVVVGRIGNDPEVVAALDDIRSESDRLIERLRILLHKEL